MNSPMTVNEKGVYISLLSALSESNGDHMSYENLKNYFLGENKKFRSFGEGVLDYLNKVESQTFNKDNGYDRMKNRAKNVGIVFNGITRKKGSSGSWESWFAGGRPAREKVFMLAFVLGLDKDKTEEFIQRVYLDRPLDCRSAVDLVSYYCIRNKKPWSDAEKLLKKIKEKKNKQEHSDTPMALPYSTYLEKDWASVKTEDQLVDFCSRNCYGQNQRMKDYAAELLNASDEKSVSHYVEREITLKQARIRIMEAGLHLALSNESASLNALQPYLSDRKTAKIIEEELKKRTKTKVESVPEYKDMAISSSQIINTIVGYSIDNGRRREEGMSPAKSLSQLIDYIKRGFPDVQTLDKLKKKEVDDTAILRKAIILLESYRYWCGNAFSRVLCKKCRKEYYRLNGEGQCPYCSGEISGFAKEDVLYEYQCNINYILECCGAQPLYFGNPFDALMMICSVPGYDSPLEKFRRILDLSKDNDSRTRHIEVSRSEDQSTKAAQAASTPQTKEKVVWDDSRPIEWDPAWNDDLEPDEPFDEDKVKWLIADETSDTGKMIIMALKARWDARWDAANEPHRQFKSGSRAESELLSLVREHNQSARDILTESFDRLVIKRALSFLKIYKDELQGVAFEDLFDCGREAAKRAITTYDSGKSTDLSTHVYGWIRWAYKHRKNSDPLVVSLQDPIEDDEGNETTQMDRLADPDDGSTWGAEIDEKDNAGILYHALEETKKLLSDTEYAILSYRFGLDGNRNRVPEEISGAIKDKLIDEEDIRNAESRAFRILRSLLARKGVNVYE